ncbi:zinc finger CCHC domain-containing protein 4 [Lingula anatina]|uniref:Zinc finger CCHC domain-containing protein 4 n=1 Tax=Lingula anatina TaxID=7574 RepID=A0A1S3HUV5_LINAN|nr:zinc finger CCHC domain-containing protein 4 [Lingula anatina]|eukprot:XP_013389825.1 zinc finger CCHC domain-containing protein 4 [Lingula anatina]
MSRGKFGVDVVLFDRKKAAPHCPHGPTLLFEKYDKEGKYGKQFYACSACRDRKDCNFFQWADEKITPARQNARVKYNTSQQPQSSHKLLYHRLKKFRKLKEVERKFCNICNQLLLPDDLSQHQGHELIFPVTNSMLIKPCSLLQPLENKKTNAQYFFSEKTVQFTVNCLMKLGFEKVLCIGAPRIHEAIQSSSRSQKMETLLLDMDHRYEQFYQLDQFCRYNMFNHHFFRGDKSREVYTQFIGLPGKLVVVSDPPFGGRVEVLAHTLGLITKEWQEVTGAKKELPVLLFFPYFLEPRILESLPSFTMLDYKVDYENHDKFHEGPTGRKHGSPVRIFTNINPSRIQLPKDEGYSFCKLCQRYVGEENKHCTICNSCTSKDGRTYIHCDICMRCVKPSYSHCSSCDRCHLPEHQCSLSSKGCHLCGDTGHKRKDCPKRYQMKKRKLPECQEQEETKKKIKLKHTSKKVSM